MKPVCLINPPTTDPSEKRSYFPMALLTLGGVLKQNHVPAILWDFDLFFKTKGNMEEKEFLRLLHHGMDGWDADVFGISSICSNFPMAIYLAREIKRYKPDSLVLLGGPQPSSVPKRILEEFDFIDAVVVGEGEITLQEMIEKKFDRSSLPTISGVVTRHEGKIIQVPKRKLMDNLDDMPIPDYSLINFRDYQAQRPQSFLASLEVGRGCPFHCTFCSTSVMWENKYRVKSPGRIHQEMKLLYDEYGFDSFEFIHDNFTTSRKFVNDFCAFMEQNNHENLKWYSSSRTDCISEPLMDRMYGAGCRWLFFGIETGSQRMQEVIKKNLNFEKFEPILAHGNRLGIGSVAAFILGFPEETKEDIDETVLKAVRYKTMGTANVFIAKLSPLAGTSIFRDHLKNFKELSVASTLSPQNYGLPYVHQIIKDHPDLFSSFYHVPHENFSLAYLTKMVEFSHLLVNSDPHLSLQVLESCSGSVTKLFEYWEPWAYHHEIPYYHFRLYNEALFLEDFKEFLREHDFALPEPAELSDDFKFSFRFEYQPSS